MNLNTLLKHSYLITHSISGVAEDLPHILVDCNIQYGGVVAQQRSHRTCGCIS